MHNTTPETEVVTKRKDNEIMLDVLFTVRMLDRRLRNIESTTERVDVSSDKEALRKESVSPREIRSYILNLLKQELPEELILQILLNRFDLPHSVIKREIERAKELKPNLKEIK